MLIQTESKAQGWRAVAVFDDRPDALIFVGRSSTQVRQEYVEAFAELYDEEEREHVTTIQLQQWSGAPGRRPLGAEEHAEGARPCRQAPRRGLIVPGTGSRHDREPVRPSASPFAPALPQFREQSAPIGLPRMRAFPRKMSYSCQRR